MSSQRRGSRPPSSTRVDTFVDRGETMTAPDTVHPMFGYVFAAHCCYIGVSIHCFSPSFCICLFWYWQGTRLVDKFLFIGRTLRSHRIIASNPVHILQVVLQDLQEHHIYWNLGPDWRLRRRGNMGVIRAILFLVIPIMRGGTVTTIKMMLIITLIAV